MRLRNENAETGHLLSFISKKNRSDNFSLFFPVEGLDQFDTLLEVIEGFEKCLKDLPVMYNYMGYSISDYGNIEKTFLEIDINRIFFFEQCEFLSERSQFIEPFGKALLKRFFEKQNQIFPDIVTGAMAAGSGFMTEKTLSVTPWSCSKTKKHPFQSAPQIRQNQPFKPYCKKPA